jgi:hypothetical protein
VENTNLNKLPARCFSVLLTTGEIIIIERGKSGYFETDIVTASMEESEALVGDTNARMGITKAQRAAMVAGSMFGWDVPGADPDNYDEDGKLKKV